MAAENSILIREEQAGEATFQDYFTKIIKRKNIVISFFIITALTAAIYNIRSPDIYASSAQIIIQNPVNPLTNTPQPQRYAYEMYLASQVELMKSASVINAVVEKLELTSKYPQVLGAATKAAGRKIRGMIGIKQVGDSRVFYVTAESSDPRLCADVANGLVDEYIEKNIMAYFLTSKDLIKKWFPETEEKVKVETIYGKLKALSRDEMVQSLPVVLKDPKMAELRAKKENIERELAAYSKKYTDNNPKVINAKRELQMAREEMRAVSDKIVNDIKDTVSGRFEISNVKVIEYGEVPQAPIGPNRKKNFLFVSLMGLFLAFGLALFIDYLDNTVKTQEDVEKHIKLPYLGYVPLIKMKDKSSSPLSKDYVVVKPDETKSSLLEALRNIRTSIIFSAPPDVLKSILIASALPKEGKSTVSLNLAVTIASDGARTLLVDGDMRRPNLHKMFELKNMTGLSNYLTSRMKLDDIIQDTKFQNLKFISCGPIPPNPSELFGSYRMKELLDEAKMKFDRVIFDGAPIFGISDSVVLAKALDGVIQVARFGKVTWDIANKSKERLQRLGIKIIGVIINGVDVKRESYYYKYYDYRYHKYYE